MNGRCLILQDIFTHGIPRQIGQEGAHINIRITATDLVAIEKIQLAAIDKDLIRIKVAVYDLVDCVHSRQRYRKTLRQIVADPRQARHQETQRIRQSDSSCSINACCSLPQV